MMLTLIAQATQIQDVKNGFFDNTLVQILTTLVIAYAFQRFVEYIIGRAVKGAVKSSKYATPVDEKKREQTLSKMLKTSADVVIWIFVMRIIWRIVDINVAALATGAGLLGAIIGFGAQDSIRNILSGIFIIAENQYRIGDIVSLRVANKDVSGTVEDVSIRITRLRDLDGNTHIIPNGSIMVTSNLSFDFANVNIDVGVGYEADIDHVEKVINTVGKKLAEDENWKMHIFEPMQFLRVDAFDESSVRIKALGKVEPAMQWAVAGEYRRRLKKAFEKESIEIPFNQVVVRKAKQ